MMNRLVQLAICGLLFLAPVAGIVAEEKKADFLSKCAASDAKGLRLIIDETPRGDDRRSLLTSTTKDGETCLHLLGISGEVPSHIEALRLVLETASNHAPDDDWMRALLNARVVTPSGLNMPPLSWYVFGGHAASLRALSAFGARKGGSGNSKDVNLVDFDAVFVDERGKEITVMDVVEGILANGGTQRFEGIKRFLLEQSAKTRAQLRVAAEWTAAVRAIEYKATTTEDSEGPTSYHHDIDKSVLTKHEPMIVVSGGVARVYVNGLEKDADGEKPSSLHPMTEEHFVQTIYVLDKHDNIVYYEELKGEEGRHAASLPFSVREGQVLTPYEYCNKHGLWEGPRVTVGATTGKDNGEL